MNTGLIRTLGRSKIEVSALGLGCWAIGGPFILNGMSDGWGDIDDAQSIKAIHRALELGINLLDTADCYGVGHSEEVIGKAIAGNRSSVVIATKFGFFGNEATKTLHGTNITPAYIERACDASLKRLGSDYIDLYQLHVGDILVSEVESVGDALDKLVNKGKIRAYGWSTDNLDAASLFAKRADCCAIQYNLNVFFDAPAMTKLCEANSLAGISRGPLAMGFLSGKFSADTIISNEDVRGAGHTWVPYFKEGKPVPEFLKALEAVREVLSSNGRTLVQGALAWIWGKSDVTVPIPGFKTIAQVEENAKAMEFGPLTQAQMDEIDSILHRARQ